MSIEIQLTEEQKAKINSQQMTLEQFLKKFNASESDIATLTAGSAAIKAVESDGYALRYVKEQTPEICIKAVESVGDALRYVKATAFETAKIVLVEGVKYALSKI